MCLEGAGVPDFAQQSAEALDKLRSIVQVFEHEEIAERRDVSEGVADDVEVVVGFDVVHADIAWGVLLALKVPCVQSHLVQFCDMLFRVLRINNELDIFQTLVLDLIAIRQNIDLLGVHVDEDMVTDVESVEVGLRFWASTLVVGTAYQTGVDVDI